MADRTEGEAVKALEAAAQALYEQQKASSHKAGKTYTIEWHDFPNKTGYERRAAKIIDVWLDSLLGDIPEVALERRAFLRELRTNLGDTDDS